MLVRCKQKADIAESGFMMLILKSHIRVFKQIVQDFELCCSYILKNHVPTDYNIAK